MSRKAKPIRSDIAWSTTDRITVRGRDLPGEFWPHEFLGDFAFLQLTGREATPQQSAVFNAIIITLVEHGLTPSAIAARLTYWVRRKPCRLRSRRDFADWARYSWAAWRTRRACCPKFCPSRKISRTLTWSRSRAPRLPRYRQANRILPGLGHPIHKPVDPRAPRLFEIAAENGIAGPYVRLIQAIAKEAERVHGRSLPVNATGAIGGSAAS